MRHQYMFKEVNADNYRQNLKADYESVYPNGHFSIELNEPIPANRNPRLMVNISDHAKSITAWQAQRPEHIFVGELQIFDGYLASHPISRTGDPDQIFALHQWMSLIEESWVERNPLHLSNQLLALKNCARYFHLYAISRCFAIASHQSRYVPDPYAAYKKAHKTLQITSIVHLGARALNSAFLLASNKSPAKGDLFIPENWLRSKSAAMEINQVIDSYFSSKMPIDPEQYAEKESLQNSLRLHSRDVGEAISYMPLDATNHRAARCT